MNRIINLFQNRKKNILSVYYTAGFPELASTVPVGKALADAGADMIEVGIPFSDPVADGPVIQQSNKKALDNGITVRLLIQQVAELREQTSIPIVLMGYLNPVLQYGFERFCKDAAAAGVDGLILPDMPMDEYLEYYKDPVESSGLVNAFLISPTTSEARIRKIDNESQGFIYAVSASSTTGARNTFSSEQIDYFTHLQSLSLKNPFLIGFGISNHETFSIACNYGSGAIVGSAFINLLNSSKETSKDIGSFVQSLRLNGRNS